MYSAKMLLRQAKSKTNCPSAILQRFMFYADNEIKGTTPATGLNFMIAVPAITPGIKELRAEKQNC